jgi:predicted esterase YcpF (UPF0227 family)
VSRQTLIYLHGFRSSPASTKAKMIEAAVRAIPESKRPLLHVPALSHRPSEAMATIEALARHADPIRLAFIGSSLGGFYATVAAERFGSRAVVINPTVQPHEDLREAIGPQVNLYTGEKFEVTPKHFEELRAMRVSKLPEPERFLLLAQTGDEVLDYRLAVRFYAGGWQLIQGGGDHAFAGFEAQIPTVLCFCSVADSHDISRSSKALHQPNVPAVPSFAASRKTSRR